MMFRMRGMDKGDAAAIGGQVEWDESIMVRGTYR